MKKWRDSIAKKHTNFNKQTTQPKGFSASLDAPRLKSRPGDGDVHPTEIVTAHANYNPSLLFYTTAKMTKCVKFSLSFFPYGKLMGF